MENTNIAVFGFCATQLIQLQYIGSYDTKEDAFNDIPNLEKRFAYSHFVIYKKPNYNCNDEMFKFHGYFNQIVAARRSYETDIKNMSWAPMRYLTNDYKNFYFI